MTDQEITQCAERLTTQSHWDLFCLPMDQVQCRTCKQIWDASFLLDPTTMGQLRPCSAVANTPFVPDPELFPLGDGSSLDEDTAPGSTWRYPVATPEVKKECEAELTRPAAEFTAIGVRSLGPK